MKRLRGSALAATVAVVRSQAVAAGAPRRRRRRSPRRASTRSAGFEPAAPVRPGKPTVVSFTVHPARRQAPGPTTAPAPVPHRGARDPGARRSVHHRPPASADRTGGRVRDAGARSRSRGPYHVLVDIYPASKGPGYTNVQLTQSLRVAGQVHPQPLPPFSRHSGHRGLPLHHAKPCPNSTSPRPHW